MTVGAITPWCGTLNTPECLSETRAAGHGDRKKVARKVFAQLALSIHLISEGLRLPSIERRRKVAARHADRAPYSLIVFSIGGGRSPLFARNAPSDGGGNSVARAAG